jgi:hypothetical protein
MHIGEHRLNNLAAQNKRDATTKSKRIHTHTHTHTHIYIYIYIFDIKGGAHAEVV